MLLTASMAVNIFWFRRDLRLHDNAGLYHALKSDNPVLPVFVFDTNILHQLDSTTDRRVEFIHGALYDLQQQLQDLGSSLEIYHETPIEMFNKLVENHTIEQVFTNIDYEPYALERDEAVAAMLLSKGISFFSYKDQVILDRNEVVKDDGRPYTVFTPYSKRWKATVNDLHLKEYPVKKYVSNFFQQSPRAVPSLAAIGFTGTGEPFPSLTLKKDLIKKYDQQRDFPGIAGTSRMGVHLRFGTVSIRGLVKQAMQLNETYLKELIWREFYHMILWHFPHVGKGKAFKPEYDLIQWRNNEKEFERWRHGATGYPIVDAGMRELNTTGFMHNRVRMITASFLAKHLLIDWRWGEAYFASKLIDYDLANNNGGWQWAAGSGCDAAPYFRIFNPALQTKRFDPDLTYIKQWVPEWNELTYPTPVVEHEFARKRCLEVYKQALDKR